MVVVYKNIDGQKYIIASSKSAHFFASCRSLFSCCRVILNNGRNLINSFFNLLHSCFRCNGTIHCLLRFACKNHPAIYNLQQRRRCFSAIWLPCTILLREISISSLICTADWALSSANFYERRRK